MTDRGRAPIVRVDPNDRRGAHGPRGGHTIEIWRIPDPPAFTDSSDPGPTQRTASTPRQRQLTFNATQGIIPPVYGRTKIGGNVIGAIVIANTFYLVLAWCHGEIQQIESIQIDNSDSSVFAGSITITSYLGTNSQGVDPTMAGLGIGWDSGYPGLAYSVFKIDQIANVNGVPSITAIVKGRKVADPRVGGSYLDQANKIYTANPVLILADVMTDPLFGGAIDTAKMNWANSITTSANYCDVDIAPADPGGAAPTAVIATAGTGLSGPRTVQYVYTYIDGAGNETAASSPSIVYTIPTDAFQHSATVTFTVGAAGTVSRRIYRKDNGTGNFVLLINGAILDNTTTTLVDIQPTNVGMSQIAPASRTPTRRFEFNSALDTVSQLADWIDSIRALCQAWVPFNGRTYDIICDQPWVGAPAATFNIDNIVGDTMQLTRSGFDAIPTRVEITYTDITNDAFVDATIFRELESVTTGAEDRRTATYNLPQCTSGDQAARHAIYFLNNRVNDLLIAFDSFQIGLLPLPGDVVEVSHSIGLVAAQFRMNSGSLADDGSKWSIKAREYTLAAYSDTVIEEDPQGVGSTINPKATPIAVTGLDATPSYTVVQPWRERDTYLAVQFDTLTNPFVVKYVARRGLISDTWATMTDERSIPVDLSGPPGQSASIDFFPFISESIVFTGSGYVDTVNEYKVIVRGGLVNGTLGAEASIQVSSSSGSADGSITVTNTGGTFSLAAASAIPADTVRVINGGGGNPHIDGFTAPAAGEFTRFYLLLDGGIILVKNEAAAASAANRITNQLGTDFQWQGPSALVVDYDSLVSRWRITATSIEGVITALNGAALSAPATDGTVGQAIVTDGSGHLSFATVAGGSSLTTKGDLQGYSTVPARLPVGANGKVVQGDSAQTLGLGYSTLDIDAATHKVINVVNPTSAQHAATKDYTDTALALKADKATGLTASEGVQRVSGTDMSAAAAFKADIHGLTAKPTPLSTDEIIIYDLAGSVHKKIAISQIPLAGGGNVTSSGLFASRPSFGVVGNLYFATDTLMLYRDTGTAWEAYGPLQSFGSVAPLDPGTWLNQSTSTIDTTNGGLCLECPALAGTRTLRGREAAYGAGSVNKWVTDFVTPQQFTGNTSGDNFVGIYFRQNQGANSGRIIQFGLYKTTSDAVSIVIQENSANGSTFGSTPTAYATNMSAVNGLGAWIRMRDDGTSLVFQATNDPTRSTNWTTLLTLAHAAWTTAPPDLYGIFGSSVNSNGTLISGSHKYLKLA